jgi:hypothetical protein
MLGVPKELIEHSLNIHAQAVPKKQRLHQFDTGQASMQPRKYSKKNFKMELQKKPKTTSEVLKEPAVLNYEELGGCREGAERFG